MFSYVHKYVFLNNTYALNKNASIWKTLFIFMPHYSDRMCDESLLCNAL